MSAGRPVLSGVDWFDVAPPLRVGSTPAIALRIRMLLLATAGFVVLWLGDAALLGLSRQAAAELPSPPALTVSNDALPLTLLNRVADRFRQFADFVAAPFVELASQPQTIGGFVLHGSRALWRLLWLPCCFTPLMRLAALGITRGEAPNVLEACRYTWQCWRSILGATLIVTGGLVVLALPLVAARMAMAVAWLAWPVAVLWPVVITLSLLFVAYAVGAIIGWPLIFATLATESSDAFDAVSRTYAYVYQRPWQFSACIVVAVFAIALGGFALEVLLSMLIGVSNFAAGSGLPAITFWQDSVGLIASGYVMSAFATAVVATYLVLRRAIDGVEVNDVWVEATEFGLPTEEKSDREQAHDEEAHPLARAG